MTRSPLLPILAQLLVLATIFDGLASPRPAAAEDPDTRMNSESFAGLELRSIGPALMAGRIADIAVHPDDQSTWYVAVGSGGVWKTENAGTTWESIVKVTLSGKELLLD